MTLQAMAAAAFDRTFPPADPADRARLRISSDSANSLFAGYDGATTRVFLKILPETPSDGVLADADPIEPDAAVGALLNAYVDRHQKQHTQHRPPLRRFVPRYLGAFRCPAVRTRTSIALHHGASAAGRDDVHQIVAFERIDRPLALWDAVADPTEFAARCGITGTPGSDDLAAVALAFSVGRFLRAMMELGTTVRLDRKSTRLNSSHITRSRMPSSA